MTSYFPNYQSHKIYCQENVHDKDDLKFIQSLFNQPYMLTNPEMFRYRTKIYLPNVSGINYVGLLIGPKGTYQKKLEEQTGCKILIRGKNSHKEGYPPQPDDNEEQHILILSDQESKIQKAQELIDKIINSDEQTRHQIRLEQLQAAQELSKQYYSVPIEDHLLTPYGPPTPHAYIIPVPNECVGLIIGKGGDTIRQLQLKSGARIQVAKKQIPDSNLRNVFIEGSLEKYENARKMIENIVEEHRQMHQKFQSLIAGTHPLINSESPTHNSNSDENNSYSENCSNNNLVQKDQKQPQQYNQHQQQQQMSQANQLFYQQQSYLHMQNEQQKKAFLFHQEQQKQMEKQLETNPFPGPHTFVSIPNAITAYIIGYNGEKIRKLHQQTGAYIFIPKDFNTLTDERVIQLSGNDHSVSHCKAEIKKIVKEMSEKLGIDLVDFKATKQLVEEKFLKIMKSQSIKQLNAKEGDLEEQGTDETLRDRIKNEFMKLEASFPLQQKQENYNYMNNNNQQYHPYQPQQYYQKWGNNISSQQSPQQYASQQSQSVTQKSLNQGKMQSAYYQ